MFKKPHIIPGLNRYPKIESSKNYKIIYLYFNMN
jgi:hypothetical protein